MGCGSSSTAVQTFQNPEENKNYQSHQKVPSRQASAASSIRSKKSKKSSRKSSASSRSSSKSADSSRQKREEGSRANSASTRKTYTVQRQNSEVVNASTLVTPIDTHVDNESEHENDVEHLKSANAEEEKKLEAQRHHEEIQKQTFLTGDPDHEVDTKNVTGNYQKSRSEDHEEIAKRKEEKRSRFNHEEVEEEFIKNNNAVPLSFPSDMDEAEEINAEYTIDDIVEHNNEVSGLDWFKYGKKIYSWKKMEPIIKGRVDHFKDLVDPYITHSYPIYIARQHKVSRKELAKVLLCCHVGYSVEVPEEQKLSRMKQSAENVLEELDSDSDYAKEFRDQLNRWLASYPHCKIANDPPDATTNPNELTFPLPADIHSDPTVLRKWIETWTAFDCEVPAEGAWVMAEFTNEGLGDTNEVFANAVKEGHGIEALDPLDMTIDGDAAWFVIELDLFKNDQTTEQQENVWKKRATRTNLNDPVWMKNRREELGDVLKKRYMEMEKDYPMENFKNFAEILEKHWEEFQTLCAKEFTPPVRKVRETPEIKPDSTENYKTDKEQVSDHMDNTDNKHIFNHDDESQMKEDRSVNEHCDYEANSLVLESNIKQDTENNERSESRGSFDGTCKRDTPENNSRAGSGRSSSNKGISSDDKLRTRSRESDQSTKKRDSPENILRLQSRESSRTSNKEEGSNNVIEDQDQMPNLETNDSGLDLTSNDQLDVGKASVENEKKEGDNLQLSDKNDVNGGTKKDDGEAFDDFY
ncbi:uncharacterized protein LOC132753195 [Ruditapes philippinarum]|uniref:uncharacterized protein LOC132753195 n=1 Tax=Ruditapes philippinarum TaxID=129788 RepID=UPI00295AE854|nr:uncharacterized protein LOC132753195 [Ruditapes philippinarum]XP_060599621.1 uncharacterized protein LOC132753195 [Ruditapes philippinarum]XP_060599622.1 uncharacterized protein LOC132753195 [Ruditapes philippinarum]